MHKRSNQTLTSTTDLEDMIDDFNDEVEDNTTSKKSKASNRSRIDTDVSFSYIDFPIENKVNSYIVNLYSYENIDKEVGHWITIMTKNTNAIVYTCFGLYSKNLLGALGKMGYKEVVFDLTPNQPLNSKSCGFYCLRYILDEEWKNMVDYLWFVRNDKTSNSKLEHWEFDLNVRPEIKNKLKKNNDVYRRSLRKTI